jgi:hypothetical protein
MTYPSIIHAIDGRVRFRIPHIHRSPSRAKRAEEVLKGVEGTHHVEANHLTGSLLVLFDSQRLNIQGILVILSQIEGLRVFDPVPSQAERSLVATVIADVALDALMVALL